MVLQTIVQPRLCLQRSQRLVSTATSRKQLPQRRDFPTTTSRHRSSSDGRHHQNQSHHHQRQQQQQQRQRNGFFHNLWERYTQALLKNPLTIKGTTASLIFFASDSATQYLTEPDSPYDLARAGSGATFGVVATFWLHYWWNFLEAFIGRRIPVEQSKLTNTLVKVLLDQALAAPCYIYGYYVVTNFIQDYTSPKKNNKNKAASQILDETTHRAGEMLLPTMLRHWTIWPIVHTFNFYFNPLHHRVLVQNLVLVGWSGYLSHLNNGGLMTPKDEIEVTIKRHESLRQQDGTTVVSTTTARATASSSLKREALK